MRERRAEEKKGASVPAYIVTYSDMVTLLLTFFVMLLTLARVQDAELYNIGRDSFLQSLNQFGVGSLFGGVQKPNFGEVKIKYFINRPDARYEDRTIDANDEELRRAFNRINRSVQTMPSEIAAKNSSFSVTDIRFGAGEAVLDASAKRFLTGFCQNLQAEASPRGTKLYILGLAGEEGSEKDQWILSARRAQSAADYMKESLGSQWPVYCWGAGPGGFWVDQDSPIYAQSQILIGVLRSGE